MKLSFRKAILIYTLVPIITLSAAFAINNLIMVKQQALQSIEEHMTDLAISYAGIFDGFLKPIEGAAKINASLVEETDSLKDENIYKLLELQVENNPIIYGAAIAFMPDQYSPDRHLFAPYVYQQGDELVQLDIAKTGYDYTTGWAWWERTVATGKANWSEPYFDEGAGNMLMSTYAVPFYKNGQLWGVATADIALDKISKQIQIPGVKGQEITVLSTTGKIILYWDKEAIGKSIYAVIDEKLKSALLIGGNAQEEELLGIQTQLNHYVDTMLAGEAGVINIQYLGNEDHYWNFFAPIKSVGWSFSIRVKESQIYQSVYEQFWLSVWFFCGLIFLIIVAIVLVSGKFSRSMDGLMKRCQRIERLNFQPSVEQLDNIEEISQLSYTLDEMCLVLDSHFSIKENVRIADAIRQHALPNDNADIELKGYQIASWSNAGGDSCGEVFDFMRFSQRTDLQGSFTDKEGSLALILLDDADSGIDAAIKNGQLRAIFRVLIKQGKSLTFIAGQMNDYLLADMLLNGPVQLSLAFLDSSNATFSCLNLGQNTVFHYSAEKLSQYAGYQQALAVQKNLSGLHAQSIGLEPGDIIVICSDGVTGAQNEQREQFAKQSIERIVKQCSKQSTELIIQSLQSELQTFTAADYMQTERSIIMIKRVDIQE
ncbi:SpoIIE family protein phosphatase [Methyloprofundus sp.]|uniref:PDC sensor domain-containing protein n=1 Tax=Methyloprofundus sp. TaxID=2020875 RepID=UPI003D13DC78